MGRYLYDRGPDNIGVCFKSDAVMNAKDKNGVELKVGDQVKSHAGTSYTIAGIGDNEVQLVSGCQQFYLANPTSLSLFLSSPRTYTEAEMKECFEAGINRNDYEADGCDAEYFAPDFQEFIQSLNNPKP